MSTFVKKTSVLRHRHGGRPITPGLPMAFGGEGAV